MKGVIYPACILILLLSACSGNSLSSKSNNEISVNSEPAGASVYVMGNQVGTTPTVVKVSTVYPVTYSRGNEKHYGRIKLVLESCKDRSITISASMISRGVNAKLDCQSSGGQDVDVHPSSDKSANQRLKELQVIKDDGLISEKEYQQIRNRILQSF